MTSKALENTHNSTVEQVLTRVDETTPPQQQPSGAIATGGGATFPAGMPIDLRKKAAAALGIAHDTANGTIGSLLDPATSANARGWLEAYTQALEGHGFHLAAQGLTEDHKHDGSSTFDKVLLEAMTVAGAPENTAALLIQLATKVAANAGGNTPIPFLVWNHTSNAYLGVVNTFYGQGQGYELLTTLISVKEDALDTTLLILHHSYDNIDRISYSQRSSVDETELMAPGFAAPNSKTKYLSVEL